MVDEGGAVGESVWDEWWCVHTVGCGGVVAVDGLEFLVVDYKGKASVATYPICCFHRGCKFCALLFGVVYCCIGGLAGDLIDGNCGDLCSHRLTDGCFVGCQ